MRIHCHRNFIAPQGPFYNRYFFSSIFLVYWRKLQFLVRTLLPFTTCSTKRHNLPSMASVLTRNAQECSSDLPMNNCGASLGIGIGK